MRTFFETHGTARTCLFGLGVVAMMAFAACESDDGNDPGGGGGGGGWPDMDNASVGGSAVLAAHEAGEISAGEAALVLNQIFVGMTDQVDDSLLAEPGDVEAVHLFLWGLDPDTFSQGELEALTGLQAAVFGSTRDSSPNPTSSPTSGIRSVSAPGTNPLRRSGSTTHGALHPARPTRSSWTRTSPTPTSSAAPPRPVGDHPGTLGPGHVPDRR